MNEDRPVYTAKEFIQKMHDQLKKGEIQMPAKKSNFVKLIEIFDEATSIEEVALLVSLANVLAKRKTNPKDKPLAIKPRTAREPKIGEVG